MRYRNKMALDLESLWAGEGVSWASILRLRRCATWGNHTKAEQTTPAMTQSGDTIQSAPTAVSSVRLPKLAPRSWQREAFFLQRQSLFIILLRHGQRSSTSDRTVDHGTAA
ncbi:hypothetical protein RB5221 [Rhodopirellula baltica SH 1]|uniref:Uncharacterized protein n=1 Tax=Rhodopirellula baltica (strain DSM 10527 / NCIMB 13988 / SH1) TaxID=243090 RepID=Q7UGH2_RHOBA|nr:hypothetical protein RB5221 [Rhodopirellula baltica SH 1]